MDARIFAAHTPRFAEQFLNLQMLSITKINSASAKSGRPGQGGYLFYLDSPTTREKGDFDE